MLDLELCQFLKILNRDLQFLLLVHEIRNNESENNSYFDSFLFWFQFRWLCATITTLTGSCLLCWLAHTLDSAVCTSCCLLTSCYGCVKFLKSIELPPSGPGPYFRQCTCVIPDNLLKTAENRNHDSLGIGVGTALVGLSSVLLSSSGKKNKFGHLLLYSWFTDWCRQTSA